MTIDLEAKRRWRILRSETHRLNKSEGGDATGTSEDAGTRPDQMGEWMSNAVRRTRSPSQDSHEDQQ